jgi:proteasome assembly chaperone (PAC2) family protein
VSGTDDLVWERPWTARTATVVVAFAGWFDAASAATGAIEHLIEHTGATRLAHIADDRFVDMQQTRPRVVLRDGVTRTVEWQENVFYATEHSPDGHELVLLAGIEPHYAWREFAHLIVATALGADARLVVSLGASPAQAPHTRMPKVHASSASPALANDFGLRRPRYEGITGIVGVLQTELDARSWPAISLQVGVPFYATGATNWKAAAALLRTLEHVTGVPTGHQELAPVVAEWEAMVDDALLESPEGLAMVPRLEAAYDRETEQQLPSAGDLVEELERFLRDQPPGSPGS